MSMTRRTMLSSMLATMGATAALSAMASVEGLAQTGAASGTVYELRVYHTNEGKLNDLLARFRDHTITIFKRHGIESVAYWTPLDEPLAGQTLFYILRHPSREAATANWDAFRNDPEWKQVSAASDVNGKIVQKTESTFLALTDFSPKI